MKSAAFAPFPLVGRDREMEVLRALLDDAEQGRGRTVFLSGESGIGKTRLAEEITHEAAHRKWTVALGRAYEVESGVPFAPIADALLPILRALSSSSLATLTRGGIAEIALLFPTLLIQGMSGRTTPASSDTTELKSRLYWTLLQFLRRLSERTPLLIVLENLQWADTSSLELLHFIARQIGGARIAILCTHTSASKTDGGLLGATAVSLINMGAAVSIDVPELSRSITVELVQSVLANGAGTSALAAMLYESTRGNPLFIQQTIRSLVASGKLRSGVSARREWDGKDFELPASIRDLFIIRLARLSESASAVAGLAAILGTRVSHDLLRVVCALPVDVLLHAIGELRDADVLIEFSEATEIFYDFSHPMLRKTVQLEMGHARARILHARVASRMEEYFGTQANAHASELAYHYVRADARELQPQAIVFLVAAGRAAAERHAYREAVAYVGTAYGLAKLVDDRTLHADIVEQLARAKQHSGDFKGALELWQEAEVEALGLNSLSRLAEIERKLGNLHYLQGRHVEAAGFYEAGIAAARQLRDERPLGRLLIAKATTLEALGDTASQESALREALAIAEREGDTRLLARVHRASALFFLWTCSPPQSLEHARNALAFATKNGDSAEAWSAHWTLGVLSALTGDIAATKRHVSEARRLADELHSPVFHLRVDEIEIELRISIGDWSSAAELGADAIALARSLEQRALLPRLLAYSGGLSIALGRVAEGKQFLQEAWDLSGAGSPGRRADVHTLIRVHTGMAVYHLSVGEYDESIRRGSTALAVADRVGYAPWAVHCLLPCLIEASMWKHDLEMADFYCKRLQSESERIGHRIGLLFAEFGAAISAMLKGTTRPLVDRVVAAADQMDAIPFPFEAARLRAEIARRYVELGLKTEAIAQLRIALDAFARLGARGEIEKVEKQLADLDARPRGQPAVTSGLLLSSREREILHLVRQHKSNKEIASALGCAARSVGKHLENACRKLGTHTRHEAAAIALSRGLL